MQNRNVVLKSAHALCVTTFKGQVILHDYYNHIWGRGLGGVGGVSFSEDPYDFHMGPKSEKEPK